MEPLISVAKLSYGLCHLPDDNFKETEFRPCRLRTTLGSRSGKHRQVFDRLLPALPAKVRITPALPAANASRMGSAMASHSNYPSPQQMDHRLVGVRVVDAEES